MKSMNKNKNIMTTATKILISLLILYTGSVFAAGQLVASWTPNTEPDLGGYNLFYGTDASTEYHTWDYVSVGKTVTQYTIEGLVENQTYYVVLTAFDTTGNESSPSAMASATAAATSQSGGSLGTFTASSNEGVLDIDGSFLNGSQSTGDLVQLIYAGEDNTIQPPTDTGQPTGDDIVIGNIYIGLGVPDGESANGRFSHQFTSELLQVGRYVYVRAFNAPLVTGNEIGYGDSQVYLLASTDDSHNFGQWQCLERQSTPVEMTAFSANAEPGRVILKWTTHSETENLGFHVFRATSSSGKREILTQKLVPGQINTQTRHDYLYEDTALEENQTYYYWVADVATNGVMQFHGHQKVVTMNKPTQYVLSQNYPNPFNPTTNIQYDLKEAGHVRLEVYNVTGQLVKELVNGFQETGAYTVNWDATNAFSQRVPSGVYLYVIQVNDFRQVKKMSLLK